MPDPTPAAADRPGPIPASEYRFHFKSGRVCLDLVATVGERWRRNFERLRQPGDLGNWLRESGLLASAAELAPSEAELRGTRELREAIYRLTHPGSREEPARADIELLNASAALPDLIPELSPDGRTTSVRAGSTPVTAGLATIARDAIELLASPRLQRVRECAAEDCALLFCDGSRPGRRRWCSMGACGNRNKTAGYRARVRHRENAGQQLRP